MVIDAIELPNITEGVHHICRTMSSSRVLGLAVVAAVCVALWCTLFRHSHLGERLEEADWLRDPAGEDEPSHVTAHHVMDQRRVTKPEDELEHLRIPVEVQSAPKGTHAGEVEYVTGVASILPREVWTESIVGAPLMMSDGTMGGIVSLELASALYDTVVHAVALRRQTYDRKKLGRSPSLAQEQEYDLRLTDAIVRILPGFPQLIKDGGLTWTVERLSYDSDPEFGSLDNACCFDYVPAPGKSIRVTMTRRRWSMTMILEPGFFAEGEWQALIESRVAQLPESMRKAWGR